MKYSEQIDQFAPAFVRAQARFGHLAKNADNPFYNSRYADLAACIEAVRESLAQEELGFLHSFKVTRDGDWYVLESTDKKGRLVTRRSVCVVLTVRVVILHSSGQQAYNEIELPVADGTDLHGICSAVTLLRRHLLQSALGIAAGDDDGNVANQTSDQLRSYNGDDFQSDWSATKAVSDKKRLALVDAQAKEIVGMLRVLGCATTADILRELDTFGLEYRLSSRGNPRWDLIPAHKFEEFYFAILARFEAAAPAPAEPEQVQEQPEEEQASE